MASKSDNKIYTFKAHRRGQHGQTVVIALLVLLLLSFIGALFVTIVASNVTNQGRSQRTLSADYYAQAGLRFADDQLTNSLDGADWRPPMQYQLAAPPSTSYALARYNAIKSTLINLNTAPYSNDPDKVYLAQGFTRYNTQNGRFLLRVSYDPINSSAADPTQRYIKIESIGRQGVITPDDPTTYTNQGAGKLAVTLVAYKPIGITDYARFETNIDNRAGAMNLGVPSEYAGSVTANAPSGIVTPGVFDFNISNGGLSSTVPLLPYPITTTYGAPNAYMENAAGDVVPYTTPMPAGDTLVPGGGSIRANGTLRFYGVNNIYLSRPPAAGSTTPVPNVLDDVEVAGRLLLDGYNPGANLDNSNATAAASQPSALILNPPTTGNAPVTSYATPTNDTAGFSTEGGAVRDGGTGGSSSDAQGYPRSIARLDPPVITAVNTATNLTRYQAITENSPERMFPGLSGGVAADGTPNPVDATAGQDGLGQSIYVNNFSDIQRDSTGLVGGHTLVDDWLNKTSGGQADTSAKNGWDGPFYNPPGVDVTFGLQKENIGGAVYSFYGIKLTRSDVNSNGTPILWKNPDGTPGNSPTMIVSYHDLNASNDPAALTANAVNPNNDIIIYCEGNVRIKPSQLSAFANETVYSQYPRLYNINGTSNPPLDDTVPRHITLITNGTAYIEGSILKGNPDSSITILAKDYVCLNTSQFYAGALADQNPQSTQPPSVSLANSSLLDFGAQNDVLVQDFNLTYPNAALYISGGPGAPGATKADYDFINPATGLSVTGGQPFQTPGPAENTPFIASSFDSSLGITPAVQGNTATDNVSVPTGGPSALMHITFDLAGNSNLPSSDIGQPFQLWTRLDPGTEQIGPSVSVATQDYVQQRSAVLPMDITIQAVLYAQDKSFFVIPGPWFNSDSTDLASVFATQTTGGTVLHARPGMTNANVTKPPLTNESQARFPFYGQPIDLKITIDGAVSENVPAPISAQAAWMQKWGWIPQCHGSIVGQNSGPIEYSGHETSPLTAGPTEGLTLLYDPEAGYPYDPSNGNYLRYDIYGRPLPFTPKLPVCPGLLYSGQGRPQSLLQ